MSSQPTHENEANELVNWDLLFEDRDYTGNEFGSSDDDTATEPEEVTHLTPMDMENDNESDDETPSSGDPIQVLRTATNRQKLIGQDLTAKVVGVLEYMDVLGLDLPIFMDALSWGDEECNQNGKVRYQRSALLHSVELPAILRRWSKPPISSSTKKKRARGASPVMHQFALELVEEIIDQELENLAPDLKSPVGDDVRAETLTSTGFEGMQASAEEHAPSCLRLLKTMATRTRQKKNTGKNPEKRIDNKSEFGNGTAATVYVKPDAVPLSEEANINLKKQRAEGLKNPLTGLDVVDLAQAAYPRILTHTEHQVLRFLLEAPDFDIQTYSGRNSDVLTPPPPVNLLPSGPKHVTRQFLLGTVNIPEASYEDHERLIDEWFNQLGWKNPRERMKLAMHGIVAWVGDQLTVDRLRGLFKFRAEDENSFERLDFMVLTFGWLHLKMAFANSLHKQYIGTSRGQGLRHAFETLKRKGLTKVMTAGPFHHDLDEALHHVAEAHLREDWLNIAGAKNLGELRKRSPEELVKLATELVQHHASTEALDDMDQAVQNGEPLDAQKRQLIMWNRDVLHYIVLAGAIRHGDVGLMEDFLPTLFFRFVGGGNSNYSTEVLELLQGLNREWPDEIK
ncbi:hypothetical protein H0H93_011665 [Arthromyces matolae]|nr:hypothetical protein H0H93_011665 [Arthromyces matolae]